MAIAYKPHTYITFGGTLNEITTADEIWQCGVRGLNPTTSPAPVDQGQLMNLISAIEDPLIDWFGRSGSGMSPSSKLGWIKAANIGADGKYTGEPAFIDFADVVGGGAAGAPSFCSIALSFTTGKSFGKARSGRVYPPNFGVPFTGGTAVVDPAHMAGLVTSAGELLTALSQSGSEFVWHPYVMSSSGAWNPITGVRVGNVYDVQRRRKDAVAESYSAAAWTP